MVNYLDHFIVMRKPEEKDETAGLCTVLDATQTTEESSDIKNIPRGASINKLLITKHSQSRISRSTRRPWEYHAGTRH